MVKARTWFTFFILSVGTIAATASCGSDEATGAGGAGGIIAGGGTGGSSVGRAGSGGGASTALGAECTTDAQCGKGLICAKANGNLFGGDGPSNGMCTVACDLTSDDAGAATCAAVKGDSMCLNLGTTAAPQGYCLDTCVVGDTSNLDTKCAGRADFVCYDSTRLPTPICVPHCRSNDECGPNLFCDKGSGALGLCSKTKPASGDPVGTPCDPSADTCEGVCLQTSDTEGFCAELCSMGSECMYGSGANPTPGGFCWGPLYASANVIDLGYCLPSCSCAGDCPFPDDVCNGWPKTGDFAPLAGELGAPGVCAPGPIVDGSVEITCEGGSGGVGAGGEGGAAGADTHPPAGGTSGGGSGGSSGGGSGGASGGSSGGGSGGTSGGGSGGTGG